MEFYPYKLFQIRGSYYLYTINASGLFEINQQVLSLLKLEGMSIEAAYSKLQSEFIYREFISLLDDMKEANFLIIKKDSWTGKIINTDESLVSLTLMIAQECNMKCTYCYGDGGEYDDKGMMESEVALRAIDYLIENSVEDKITIAFMGGEPLTNFELIRDIVEYCKIQEEKYGKSFLYTTTTNGTLLNDEIEKYLIDNHITTQISIDGIKEKHDRNRFFANKKGSYDRVVRNTESMRKKSLLTARATVSHNNLDYIEIFQHLNSMGFRAIPIAAAQNMLTDTDYEKLMESYKKYISYFESLVKNKNYNIALKMTDIIGAMKRIEYGGERYLGCGAAKNMYAVDIHGNLYPCHRFVSSKEHSLGNIYEGVSSKRDEFVNKLTAHDRSQCSKCWVQNLCVSGCPNENYSSTGNIQTSSPNMCKFYKMQYEELIKVYINFDEDDKKIFDMSLERV